MSNTPPILGLVEWLRPGDHARVERLIGDMGRLGMTHLRTGISWADCHTAEGRAWTDWLLPRLARAGVEVLPCVTYTPPSLGLVPKTSAPPRETKAYADFLDDLVTRHGDLFEWVELWNEPNNLNDWDWRLDPEWKIYADMVVKAAWWMHRRGKKTVLGGMCPTDPNWIRRIGEHGALADIDAISLHGFPGTWTHDGATWAAQVAEVRAALPPAQRDSMEVWITEAGYSTWRHDERGQMEVLLDLMTAPAQRVYWYAWQDLAPEIASQEGFHVDERHYHFGLMRADGSPKLAARLLQKGGMAEVGRVAAMADGAPFIRHDRPVTLITGGAGFLGANLADALAGQGRTVRILDALSRLGVEDNLAWLRDRHGDRIEAVCGDIRDKWTVRDVVADAQTVFHLAAQVAVTTSVTDPRLDFEINLGGVLNVLEAARTRPNPPRLLFASTNKVYGGLDDVGVRLDGEAYVPDDRALAAHGVAEDRPLDLHSPYGCSKGGADQYVLDHARIYGLNAAVLRMSCLYGPRQFGTEDQGWLAHFLIRALNGAPITLYGDGRQVRDLLYVDDAVAAWMLAEQSLPGIRGRAFNLGGGPGNALSLLGALRLLEDVAGTAPEVAFGPWRPGDQLWYVSDTRAFSQATGWAPHVAPAQGVRRLAEWLRAAGIVAPADLSQVQRMAV